MELQCPQCGKWMAVSQEELLMHDSQVVCPQCLAVCRYEDDHLVVRDDSDAPYRHTATVAEMPRAEAHYCYSCGKQLPSGIRFCPYCGADLEAPFDKTADSVIPPKTESEPVAHQEKRPSPQPEPEPESKSKPKPVSRRPSSVTQVQDNLRTISHSYNGSGMHLQQHGSKPSVAFKVVAYTVIAVLLALLVYIINAGLSIEPMP